MRDPVERCLSTVAMQKRNGNLPEKTDYSNDIILYSKSKRSEIRTNYKRTVEHVEEAFKQCAIYYSIFGEMFETHSIYKLASFLGVSPQYGLANIKLARSAYVRANLFSARSALSCRSRVSTLASRRDAP
jgi:hypothetical protein